MNSAMFKVSWEPVSGKELKMSAETDIQFHKATPEQMGAALTTLRNLVDEHICRNRTLFAKSDAKSVEAFNRGVDSIPEMTKSDTITDKFGKCKTP